MVTNRFRMAGGEAILNAAFNMKAILVLVIGCVSYRHPPMISSNNPSVLPTAKAGNAASYGFSVSLPDKYLWMTLDKSV